MNCFARFLMILGLATGVVIPTLAASSDPETEKLRKQVEALQTKVEALEAQVKALAARLSPPPGPAGTPAATGSTAPAGNTAPSSASYENEAQALINDVIRLTDQGEPERARARIEELRAKYPASKVAGQGTYFANELEVVGKSRPPDWGIEKWFQGQSQVDLSAQPATLVVFWEEWCPHCKEQMPKAQQLFARFQAQGLQVLGITKVSQTATDEKVQAYLKENQIQFAVGKENGNSSTYFNVKGIPAAAILKGGKIVWRGHPIRLTEDLIKRWL